jgi:hypothetical protein
VRHLLGPLSQRDGASIIWWLTFPHPQEKADFELRPGDVAPRLNISFASCAQTNRYEIMGQLTARTIAYIWAILSFLSA